jgi:hypothetical protein
MQSRKIIVYIVYIKYARVFTYTHEYNHVPHMQMHVRKFDAVRARARIHTYLCTSKWFACLMNTYALCVIHTCALYPCMNRIFCNMDLRVCMHAYIYACIYPLTHRLSILLWGCVKASTRT